MPGFGVVGLALSLTWQAIGQTASVGLSAVPDPTSFSVRGTSELELACAGSFSVGWSGSIRDGERLAIPLAQGGLRAEVRFTSMGVRDSAGAILPANRCDWNLNGWSPDVLTGDAVRFEGSSSVLSGDVIATLDASFTLSTGPASWRNGAGIFQLGTGSGSASGRDENAPASVELSGTATAELSYEAVRWTAAGSGRWSASGAWNVGQPPAATQPGGMPGFPVLNPTGATILLDRDLNGLNWFDRSGGTLMVVAERAFTGENTLQGNGRLLLDGLGARLATDSLVLGEGFLVSLDAGAQLMTPPGTFIAGEGRIDLVGDAISGPSRLISDGVGAGVDVSSADGEIEPATRFGRFSNSGFIVQTGAGTSLNVVATVLNSGALIQRGASGTLRVNGLISSGLVRVERGLLQCTGVNNTGNLVVEPEGTLRTTGLDQTAGISLIAGTLLLDTSGGDRVVSVTGGRLCGAGNIVATGPGRLVTDIGAGVVCPGSSPGILAIGGTLVCRPESVLEMEMAGSGPKDVDMIRVNGAVELGGTLRVIFLNGYTPTPGTTWDVIVSSTGLTGVLPRVEFTSDFIPRHSLSVVKLGKNGGQALRMKFLGGRIKG